MNDTDPKTRPQTDTGAAGADGGWHPDPETETDEARRAARDAAAEEAAAERVVDAATGETAPELLGDADRLAAEVSRLEAENAKLKDQLLRSLADAENLRRRAERDKEEASKFAITKFARDLLDPADNLRRALEAAPADPADEATRTLIDGVGATERELLAAFDRHGLVKVDPPPGEKFDPTYHEAMFEVPGTGHPPGCVVQVMQPGYVLNGRLVRAARVGVSKGEPQKVDTTA
jgi:molecular chaperone GrpE